MPPGLVSRGQRVADLRLQDGSLSSKRSFFSANPNGQGSSSNGNSQGSSSGNSQGSSSNGNSNNSKSSNGNSSSGSGSKSDDNGSVSQQQSHTQSSSASSPSSPPIPPCFGFCVPDNDPRVIYSASWSIKSEGLFSTTHETDVIGSWVTFNFTGSAITVFGSIPASNSTNPAPTAAYSIDAAQPFVTSEPMAVQTIDFQPLFSASQLSGNTVHTLTINVTSVQSEAPYTLDYFIVAPSSTHVSSSAVAAASAITSSMEVSSSWSNTNPFHQGVTETTVAIAAVLGTVIFALIALLVFFLVILPMRRRRANDGSKSSLFTTPESILRWSRAPSSSRGPSSRYSITSHFFNAKNRI